VSDRRFDVLVLGAGMVGTSCAVHLAGRGLSTALVDRAGPGEGTSYGNAGIIDNAAFVPMAFPRHLPTLVKYAMGRTPHLNLHWGFLPRVAGWLFDYWRQSSPENVVRAAERLAPLATHAVAEHKALAAAAGAEHLIRDGGWMHVYRSAEHAAGDAKDHALMERFGVAVEVVGRDRLAELEPHLKRDLAGAAWVPGASSTSDPEGLTKAYARHFEALGGAVVTADARGLVRRGDGWVLATPDGLIAADRVVVALGPWAGDVLTGYGVHVPIAAKRGYHMHFSASGNAVLNRPIVDVAGGYCLTPMAKGYRMTTGAEFADRDAPATPVQVERAEAMARDIFPLAERREAEPWLGRRPNTPDGVPVIGPAPGRPGMWLALGHGHWGLTLGPATGRLIADLVTGASPYVDPAPLSLERFR
jgi:D-amino-acid dehydrogenase